MSSNPDQVKQVQEIAFSRKTIISRKPSCYFKNVIIKETSVQKHLDTYLDSKLLFNEDVNDKMNKAMKGVSLLRKLNLFYHVLTYSL